LARDESRGAHYKPDFPKRDDERFLKTTIAEWTADGPKLSYQDVDTSLIKPRLRNYAAEKNEDGTATPIAEAAKETLIITTNGHGTNGHGTNGHGTNGHATAVNGNGNGVHGKNGALAMGAGLNGSAVPEMQVAAGADSNGSGDQLSTRPPEARRDTAYAGDKAEVKEAGQS
jgi:hypothetical protein